MGICKTVSVEDIKIGNPRLCLSSLRVFNRCFQCPQYNRYESRIVNIEYESLTQQRDKIKKKYLTELKDIEIRLNEIEGVN